ncbi:MAG: hypothetical protein ACE37H_15780 [Phycisphaeraceae bacterium]
MKKKLYRTWRQVTADKKKFGILVTVVAVGLLLWGRLILLEKVPRVATADPATPASSRNQGGPVSGPASVDLEPLPEVRAALNDELTLNLFAFRHDRYKLRPTEDSGHPGIQSGDSADDEQQRREELIAQARQLRLQSVIQGATPRIVINGRVLRVGDSIDGFEIASFNDRSAKVTRDGLTFTLNMLSD